MIKKFTYMCVSFYFLLTSLIAVIPGLLIPSKLMAGLAFFAGLGFFMMAFCRCSKIQCEKNETRIL